MYLLVNLSQRDTIQLALFDEHKIEHKSSSGSNREVLAAIDDLLHEQNLDKTDVTGIMVVVGTGGFTSTRIGVVVANSFAYILGIPVLAIEESDIASIQDLIPKLQKQPKGQYITAAYSGEPNIGQK